LEFVGDIESMRGTGSMRGVTGIVSFDTPMVISKAVLGSVRHLRDSNGGLALPSEIAHTTAADARSFRVTRTSLTREHHYELSLQAEGNALFESIDGGLVRILPPRNRAGSVRFTFLHDHNALTPIALDNLLTKAAAPLPTARN